MNPFKSKKGLGRGLSSLIGDIKSTSTNNNLLISDVVRSKLQPRKNFDKQYLEDLTNSIKAVSYTHLTLPTIPGV